MKKNILSTMAAMAVAFTAFAGTAQAGEEGGYVGASAGLYQLNITGAGVHGKNAFGGQVNAGYDFGSSVSTELRLFGTQAKNVAVAAGAANETNLKVSYAFSYLVKPYYEIADTGLSAYALLGGTTSKIKASGVGFSNTVTKTSFSYGLGVEGSVAENCLLGVEWFRPMSNITVDTSSKLSINAFSLSGTYKF